MSADPQWSGIQDGISFTVKHKSFSNVKEAMDLLLKMVESVGIFKHVTAFKTISCLYRMSSGPPTKISGALPHKGRLMLSLCDVRPSVDRTK